MVELSSAVHGADGKPTMVLLHGMGRENSGATWDPVLPLLGDAWRLVVPDLRGHGASPWPGTYTLAEFGDDVAELLDRLEARDATVVGHSLGALVALVLAQRRPDLVSALVMEDAPTPPPADAPPLDTTPPDRPDGPWPYDELVRPAILAETGRRDPEWARRVPQTDVPTLVIGGGPRGVDQDRLRALAERLPDATMVTIDVGHNVHPVRPEEFVAAIREWMAR